jgi:ribonucleoside-triphosphate reductase
VQDFAARVIAHLSAEARRLSDKHKVRFLLAESRDVNAPHRLARLDLTSFGQPALEQLHVPISDAAEVNEVFYTNSVKLPVTSGVSALEKMRIEGALQAGMVWNATSDLWLGSALPPAERLAVFISRAFYQTQIAALTFSPEFTICTDCHTTARGLVTVCPQCASTRVDGLAQATNRYSRTSAWPRWKMAELKKRRKEEV